MYIIVDESGDTEVTYCSSLEGVKIEIEGNNLDWIRIFKVQSELIPTVQQIIGFDVKEIQ